MRLFSLPIELKVVPFNALMLRRNLPMELEIVPFNPLLLWFIAAMPPFLHVAHRS
jgi:hypothetical protein